MRGFGPALAIAALVLAVTPATADAQGERLVTLRFQPTGRAQVAVWIERESDGIFRTLMLTQATATHGIGNRPGATQMNSGFRWPYGRREGVLPVWGHRRVEAGGDEFPRVIFNGRESEGLASVSSGEPRNSRDDYFCLSFNRSLSSRDALDAVSCASVFNSNKGRYLTEADVAAGYAEPWEEPGGDAFMRPLPLGSPYPPRRDLVRCEGSSCEDHADVSRFAGDARAVLPEIDEVTRATPQGDRPYELSFDIPEGWPDGEYVAWLEINVEGDYNDRFNDETYPTPTEPDGKWDSWAMSYGYPYRGQPSVVYRLPFTLSSAGAEVGAAEPYGYGGIHGLNGDMSPMDGAITNDPEDAPGSGVDRLGALPSGNRFEASVMPTNVCGAPEPPPECELTCGDSSPCPTGFVCGPTARCVGLCDLEMAPAPVRDLVLETHPDEKHSHQWVVLRFVVPEHGRDLRRYEVRVSTRPIIDRETFLRAMPANAASIDSVELVVPTDGAAGDRVEVEMGGLIPEAHYWVALRAIDSCNDAGEIAVAEVATTPIHFTTVSPCFVATAAWGTPLAGEIGVLRRLRDRHLLPNRPGRAVVRAYEAVGPAAAEVIGRSELLRLAARVSLTPVVALARLLD